MNIFVVNPDNYEENAIVHDDKRLVKMILESAQLLATAIHSQGGQATYKSTHVNHPCSIWARDNRSNYLWLLNHFIALNKEYEYRYNRQHKCLNYLYEFEAGQYLFESTNIIDAHPNCTKFKEETNVYEAYKKALIDKWVSDKRKPKWTKRNVPTWATDSLKWVLYGEDTDAKSSS